jgi:hypothetical protein
VKREVIGGFSIDSLFTMGYVGYFYMESKSYELHSGNGEIMWVILTK